MTAAKQLAECARVIADLNKRNRLLASIANNEQQKSALLIEERDELLAEGLRVNRAVYKMIALCAKDRKQRDRMRACLVKGLAK